MVKCNSGSEVINEWKNGNEKALMDIVNYTLSQTLNKDEFTYYIVSDKAWGRGRPDGLVYKKGIPFAIIEYKLHKSFKEAVARAFCQDLCYTWDKYKNSIIPIKWHLVVTETEVCGIKFDKYDVLYENFGLLREMFNEVPPHKLYDVSWSVRSLLSDITDMLDFKINLKDVDFNDLCIKLIAA